MPKAHFLYVSVGALKRKKEYWGTCKETTAGNSQFFHGTATKPGCDHYRNRKRNI